MKTKASSKRPRGFATWNPHRATRVVLDQINSIIGEYHDILPITLRQLFYLMVVNYGFAKDEKAYERLGNCLNRARRAGLVDWECIRDDRFHLTAEWYYSGMDEFRSETCYRAKHYAFDRQSGQDRRVLIWCEASGMVEQLERIGRPWGIKVASNGGFDGTHSRYSMACQFANEPTLVLHVGDHDPSGVHMYSALAEDVTAFTSQMGAEVTFQRIAVTPEQVEELDLPTAPAKAGDKREFDGLTTQAEALNPRQLADIVEAAVKSACDLTVHRKNVERESEHRDQLTKELQGIGWA